MGGIITKYSFKKKKQIRVVMIGLWGSGRTTILYRLKLGQLVSAVPTVGFNVQNIQANNIIINLWDVGGANKLRQLWYHYYQNSNAFIFVVDSSQSTEQIIQASSFLRKQLQKCPVKNIPILIYANKEEISQHSLAQIAEYFNINQLQNNHKVYLQSCSAYNNKGMKQGLQWITKNYIE